jgi:hypothetical protein
MAWPGRRPPPPGASPFLQLQVQVQQYWSPDVEHWLVWFHITMRLTVIKQMAKRLAKETKPSADIDGEAAVVAELQAKAQAEGKTVDELAEEALRKLSRIGTGRTCWSMAVRLAASPAILKPTFQKSSRSGAELKRPKGAECSVSPSIPTFTCQLWNLAVSGRAFSAWPALG